MADAAVPISPYAVTDSAATLYTVPGNAVFVLRSIHAMNTSGVPTSINLAIGSDDPDVRWLDDFTLDGGQAYAWSGFFPIAAGTTIQASASATDRITLFIGGVEITP